MPKYHLAWMTGGMDRVAKSEKYFLTTCQTEIQKRGSTIDWIELAKAFKKVAARDIDLQKSQVLLAKLRQSDDVVVKMGDSRIEHEYLIGRKLRNVKGFVKFLCFFECADDFYKYFTKETGAFCNGDPHKRMQVIIMPYFPLGSMTSFQWESRQQFSSCLKLAFLALAAAFFDRGIIHGDFHPMNVMVKATSFRELRYDGVTVPLFGVRPWIMDFEASREIVGDAREWADFMYDVKRFFLLAAAVFPDMDRTRLVDLERLLLNVETSHKLDRQKICATIDHVFAQPSTNV